MVIRELSSGPQRKCWVTVLQQWRALRAAGWDSALPGLTAPVLWFQALILVVVLGWVFVPIYIKAGVSICSVTRFPPDKYPMNRGSVLPEGGGGLTGPVAEKA